ncbi:MAG: tol-pal system protein YbgF [Proteobacteria bacterium]|nr:tol-pal system protein YbgF [Pseudomonadota bacterium]
MKKVFVLTVSLIFLSGCAETWKHMTKLKKDKPVAQAEASSSLGATPSGAENTDLAELRETISTLTQKVDELGASINQLTASMATRLAADTDKLEPAEIDIMEAPVEEKSTASMPSTVMENPKVLPLKEQYEAGYNLYKKGRFSDAIESFDLLLKTYPNMADYSDNALYWKGECYYSMGNFSEAIRLFRETEHRFPDGNKTPASQLKAGFAYIKMQNKEGAKKQFQKVIDLYPFSQQAEIATKKLNTL